MSVRINTNASAINTHRHVVNNAKVQERNLEKLASGMKVNRGVDGPAHIQIGEQIRSQTASLKQAIDNTEMSVSLMQTAEAALDEVSRALINARQIATHAANTGTNSEYMFEADQLEIDNLVYQSVKNLRKSIISDSLIQDLEMSCFTGIYVTGTVNQEYLNWVENEYKS